MIKTKEDLNRYLKADHSKRFSGGGAENILLSAHCGSLTVISGRRSIT